MHIEQEAVSDRVMLNAYPDSVGDNLSGIVALLQRPELKDAFQSFYILPSFFNTDLDRGFSVIDYEMNENFATAEDMRALKRLGIDLKLDFILNHLSVLSHQFQDIIENGEKSAFKDFFINWNDFWQGHGTMTEDGYIQPDPALIKDMFFRKPGLPILMVRMPDGSSVPYWNTFYQEVKYAALHTQQLVKRLHMQYTSAQHISEMINPQLEAGKALKDLTFGKFEKYKAAVIELLEENRSYLGQMDLNIQSERVWEFYDQTLRKLAEYGAKLVRLDAFAYAPKEVGAHNFLNEPGTWDLLAKVQKSADKYSLTLLPEIHAGYHERIFEKLAEKGYMTYDFFMPGLIIDALEKGDGANLARWALEQKGKGIRTVNMLGCHDGIPMLDLEGLLPHDRIEELIQIIVSRGGLIKNLHGAKNIYYQVNATYFSALSENEKKMLLARALQIFMPGKPQVWYLDLFLGKNNLEAVKAAGESGHKEINRTNLSEADIEKALQNETVKKQIRLLQFRNTCAAFGWDALLSMSVKEHTIEIVWTNNSCKARLTANLSDYAFEITEDNAGRITRIL